jgi:hypothetical protein
MASLPGFRFDITGASGSQGLLSPKQSYRVYILPRGGYAAQDSTGAVVTFDSASVASRFTVNDWVQVGTATSKIRQVAGVGGNSISLNTTVTVSENDRILLIGSTEPTVVGGSATYTTPNTIVRQRDDDAADLYTNSMITTNANGLVQGFAHTGFYDALIQDGNQANQGLIIDLEVGAHPESVFNVIDYGATGDGVTDDSTAIQRAIDTAEAEGAGEIFFPVGTYLIGTGLTVEDVDLRVRGMGRGSILKAVSGITMMTIGPSSGSLTANAGNVVSSLMFDFDSTDATGLYWQRWGQNGIGEHLHFINPGASAHGIYTSTNSAVNELIFTDINWWSSSAAGTGITIDCNNCKISNSTFIAATVAIELSPTAAISPISIEGCRIKNCATGVRVGSRGMYGLYIRDMRFEGNTLYDIDAQGFDSTNNRIWGIDIRSVYTSTGANWRFGNAIGMAIDSVTFKGWVVSGPAVVDGGNVSQIHLRNIIVDNTTTTTPIFPSTWLSSSYESLTQRSTQFGTGTDAPTTTNALVYVTREGETHIVARDSNNNDEGLFGPSGGVVRVGSKTGSTVSIMSNNSDRVYVLADGTMEPLASVKFSGTSTGNLTQAATLTVPAGYFFGVSGTLGAGTSISQMTLATGREIVLWAAAGTMGFSKSNALVVVGASFNVPQNSAVKCFCTGTTWFVFSPSS